MKTFKYLLSLALAGAVILFQPAHISAFSSDISPLCLENAHKIYSVLSYIGLPDVNIAGALGNWYPESMLDFGIVEAGAPYQYGRGDSVANNELPSYCLNTVFPAWERQGVSLRKDVYLASDGQYWPGIGVGAFTGENARRLVSVAEANGMNWYDDDFQLAYILGDFYRPGVFAGWTWECSSPEEASLWIMENWEGYTRSMTFFSSARPQPARNFYNLITSEGWECDESYASYIVGLSRSLGSTQQFSIGENNNQTESNNESSFELEEEYENTEETAEELQENDITACSEDCAENTESLEKTKKPDTSSGKNLKKPIEIASKNTENIKKDKRDIRWIYTCLGILILIIPTGILAYRKLKKNMEEFEFKNEEAEKEFD